jgi:hypothetical protein
VAPDAFPLAAARGVVQKVDWARHPDLLGAAEMFYRSSAAADALAGRAEVHLRDAVRLDLVAVTLRAWCLATVRDFLWATQDVAGQRAELAAHRGVLVRLVKLLPDEQPGAAGAVQKVMALDEPASDLLEWRDGSVSVQLCLRVPQAWVPQALGRLAAVQLKLRVLQALPTQERQVPLV